MKKSILLSLLIIFIITISSCASIPSAVSEGPRTLILNGKHISESNTDNGFTAWYCLDYISDDDDDILAEVGFFSIQNENYGFVLYDGGYTGDFANYSRQGLDHRWDWGDIENHYTLTITPDNIAAYYDFTGVPIGEKIKPRSIYKAHKR